MPGVRSLGGEGERRNPPDRLAVADDPEDVSDARIALSQTQGHRGPVRQAGGTEHVAGVEPAVSIRVREGERDSVAEGDRQVGEGPVPGRATGLHKEANVRKRRSGSETGAYLDPRCVRRHEGVPGVAQLHMRVSSRGQRNIERSLWTVQDETRAGYVGLRRREESADD